MSPAARSLSYVITVTTAALLALSSTTRGELIDSMGTAAFPSDTSAPTESHDIPDISAASIDTTALRPDTLSEVTAAPQAAIAPDSSARLWDRPFFGLGVGWTVGGMPVFDLWTDGLPSGIADLPRGQDSAVTASFKLIEDPDPYSITFPLILSYSSALKDGRRYSVGAELTRIRKSYRAKALSDSLGTWWERDERLTLSRISLFGKLHLAIPEQYFKIDQVDNASLALGLGLTPFARLSKYSRDVNRSTELTVAEEHAYNGVGFLWSAGLSTLRQLAGGNALQIGVSYGGNFLGRFTRGDQTLQRAELTDGDDAQDRTSLSFVTHRFTISIEVLMGGRAPRPATE